MPTSLTLTIDDMVIKAKQTLESMADDKFKYDYKNIYLADVVDITKEFISLQ